MGKATNYRSPRIKPILLVAGVAIFGAAAVATIIATTDGGVSYDLDSVRGAGAAVTADEFAFGGSAIVFNGAPQTGLVNSVQEVAYDMFGPARGIPESEWSGGAAGWSKPWPNHEAEIMREEANYKWLYGGWGSRWNAGGGLKATYARCNVYPAKGGLGESDFKLQIRGLKSYQRINGAWSIHQQTSVSSMQGDWYDLANFLGARDVDTKLLPVSGEEDVYEVVWPANGEIFHYFPGTKGLPSGEFRVLYDPAYNSSRDTFFVTAQMRLAPNAGVDLSKVKLLGDCGQDYYTNETGTIKRDHPNGIAPSGGHARSKFITEEWKAFNWYPTPSPKPSQTGESRSWQDLHQYIFDNPPPIEQ